MGCLDDEPCVIVVFGVADAADRGAAGAKALWSEVVEFEKAPCPIEGEELGLDENDG